MIRSLLFFAAFALAAGLGQAQMRAPETTEMAIEGLEQRWLMNQSDAGTLNAILADDFVHPVGAGVFLTKQQHIAWAVAHPQPAGAMLRFEALNVRAYGNIAVANGIVAKTVGVAPPQRTIFTDVFVLRGAHWQAINAQENVIAVP